MLCTLAIFPNCCVRCWTPSLDCSLINAKLVLLLVSYYRQCHPRTFFLALPARNMFHFLLIILLYPLNNPPLLILLQTFIPFFLTKTLLVILIFRTYCNSLERDSTLSFQPCVLAKALTTTLWMAPTFSILNRTAMATTRVSIYMLQLPQNAKPSTPPTIRLSQSPAWYTTSRWTTS